MKIMKTISEKENLPELKRNGRFAILTIAFVLLVCWAMKPEDSMTKCQETHSFDVCFNTLNR